MNTHQDHFHQKKTDESVNKPKKIEISVEPEHRAGTSKRSPDRSAEDLSCLTPTILDTMSFDIYNYSDHELRAHCAKLRSVLGKVVELLKEKSALCNNLEKQNRTLDLKISSLKDVVLITKDLLSVRNMEVENLNFDIKRLQEIVEVEKEKHESMMNKMNDASKVISKLKSEYQSQIQLFSELNVGYQKKIEVLEAENKRLASQVSELPSFLLSSAIKDKLAGLGDME